MKARSCTVLMSAAALALSASSALAGGYVAPVVEAPVVAPIAQTAQPLAWQGGYAGLTAGMAFLGDDRVGVDTGQVSVDAEPATLKISGFNYGARAGYRWQRPMTGRTALFGLELGYEAGGIGDDFNEGGYTAEVDVNNVIALRAKTGVLNAAQNSWFYGILGLARGDFDYRVQGNGVGGAINIDQNFTENGYIVGLGVERKISDRMSITGEWEYANFGKTHLEDATGKSTEATPDYHNIKLGVNYSF